ncbi:MAG: DUF1385 domain-containing protein [Thermoleophilia bacterium]
MSDESRANRLGGMALANGLLVHGPRHWAAAVRDDDGRVIVASGKKHLFRAGPITDLPLARGLVRLGEAFAVLPSVRRGLPQARFAMEDRRTISIAIGATVAAAVARRRIRSVLAQEAVGAVAGLAPAMLTLRGSRAAVWHAVEHKSIAAYEAGGADEVAHAHDHAKEHDRCGSNLILPLLVSSTIGNWVARRMLPGRALGGRTVIAAISIGSAVEMFSFSARRPEHPVSRLIHGVGHAMQAGFATTEPSPGDMLVGRAAMEALLRAEEADAVTG